MNFDLFSFFNECFCGKESVIIKSRKYYIKKAIGEGGFSTILLVESSDTGRTYAVKKIICHSLDDQKIAYNEVKFHEKIHHENIIELIDYEVVGSPNPVTNTTSLLYLVLPYYRRGTLHQELEKRALLKQPFEPSKILEIFLKICLGVKVFHDMEPPVAHRDLKTANILLELDDTPVIMDLGSAAIARVNIHNTSDAQNLQDLAAERCSMPYRAPELFNVENHSSVDERTDIWSLGCILYALCFFKSPYDIIYERGDSVALAVLNGKLSFPPDHVYDEHMEELILFLMKVNPAERPFIDSVIEKVETLKKRYLASA